MSISSSSFDSCELYTKNFIAIQKKNKRLAELIDSKKEESFFFFDSKNQELDANDRLKDFDYHSQFLVVIGLAPYYHLNNIVEQYENNIFVFEPSPSILKQKMFEHDFTKILSKENVQISSSIRELVIFLSMNFSGYEDGQIYTLGSYYIIEPAILDLAGVVISDQIQLSCVINNTLRKKSDTWIPFFFENMKYFQKYHSSRTLDNIFKNENRTCVIVGASPSVDKAIELLQPIKDNVDWFACDVSTEILKAVDIQPSAIFSLESNEFSCFRIDRTLSENSVMFLGDIANTKAYNIKSLDKYVIYQDGSGMNNDFCKVNSLGQTPVGSTVLSVAFCVALYMGYKNIIIIGSDFCYSDDKRYSQLTAFPDKENYRKCLIESGTYYKKEIFDSDFQNYSEVIDVFGKKQFTFPAYLLSRKWIGITALNHRDTLFYNITKGLPIVGFNNLILSDKKDISLESLFLKIEPSKKTFFERTKEIPKPNIDLLKICDNYKQDMYYKLMLIYNISSVILNHKVSTKMIKLFSKANDLLQLIIDDDSLLTIYFKKEIETMNAERYIGMKEKDKEKKINRANNYSKQFSFISDKALILMKQLEK